MFKFLSFRNKKSDFLNLKFDNFKITELYLYKYLLAFFISLDLHITTLVSILSVESFKIFNDTEQIQQRFHAAWPLYGLRWAMILLNEFRRDGWEKKIHVDEDIEKQREKKLSIQIDKANAVCALIKLHQMKCPYV